MASISPSIIKTGTSEKSNNQIATETSAPVTSMESNATQSSTDIAVTPQRKQELLLEARRARVEWVDSSSNPFRFDTSLDDGHDADLHSSAEANGFKAQESDQKNVIQNTYAGKSIPSVVEVVNMLYGLGEEEGGGLNQKSLNARIINQLSSQVLSEDTKKVICNHERENSSILTIEYTSNSFPSNEAIEKNTNIRQAIQNYVKFIQKLRSPESADIVQSAKHFVTSFPDIVARNAVHNSNLTDNDPILSKNNSNEKTENNDVIATAKHVAQSIHSYIDNRLESMQKNNNVSKLPNNSATNSNETQPSESQDQSKKHFILQKLAVSIQTYLNSTCESMKKSNKSSSLSSLWMPIKSDIDTEKNEDGAQSEEDELWISIQTAFESFLYSKCHDTIWSVLDPDTVLSPLKEAISTAKRIEEPNRRILETMENLHFLDAKHLEIQCILKCDAYKGNLAEESEPKSSTEHKSEAKLSTSKFNLRDVFMNPIQLLQTLPAWYSPADKLRCIHETYKEIVIVLSNLSNSSQSSSAESQPSADDILPAFIYTLIQAKPFPIISNLKFIEFLAREDQLRGEAGYAFTNLYGAVQFLLDLNLDLDENMTVRNENGESNYSDGDNDIVKTDRNKLPFAIDAEEWKAHLRRYQESKLSQMMGSMNGKFNDQDDDTINAEGNANTESNSDDKDFPSVLEIRAARLRGEEIDLNWISQWQALKKPNELPKPGNLKESKQGASSIVQDQDGDNQTNQSSKSFFHSTFPVGFTRSYTFLGKKPYDIRMGDIQQLLAEYHQLVHACETMVSERNAIQKESQKLKIQRQRNKLQNIAVAADASTSND